MSSTVAESIANIGAKLWGIFKIRLNKRPITSMEELTDFIQTRAAYIAQTSLYGYLKTRMGVRYPTVFEDAVFVESINLAKWHVFAACVADLSIFAAATAASQSSLAGGREAELARYCFDTALAAGLDEVRLGEIREQARTAFDKRIGQVAWAAAATGETAFTASPEALVRWAPIADELKQYDHEIVVNSIRFRWRDVRDQLRKRADRAAILADFQAGAG